MIQCGINNNIINITHGRDQLVYYDTWVGQLHEEAFIDNSLAQSGDVIWPPHLLLVPCLLFLSV